MNREQLALHSLDDKQLPPISIPPPPLPPIFPRPNIQPTFSHPPTLHPSQFTDTSIYPFPIHAFQGNYAPSAPMCTSSCPSLRYQPSAADSGSQEEVNYWLRSKKITAVVNKTNNINIKVYQVKEKLNLAHNLIKELENGARTLSVMVKSVTSYEWDQKCNEIEKKKRELLNVLNELKLSKEEFGEIKVKCLKLSKKRSRLRRQTLKRKIQKENDRMNTQNLHFRIDNWQKEMQEVVERNKREQEIQQEADAVLWGVRQRRSEARRQLELLSSLQELREARVRRRSSAGQSISTVEIDTFTTVISMLKELWTQYLSECQLEEQALRGMLAESEITEDQVSTYKKLVLQEWQVALFGSGSSLETNTNLLDTRRSWDRFVIDHKHTLLASTIPPGWVLPVAPSSQQWQGFLKY